MSMNQLYREIDQKMESLRKLMEEHEAERIDEFNRQLETSWIYHDNALEGIVLSHHELNSALDDAIVSDATLIPQYDDLRNHKEAIAFVRAAAARRKGGVTLDYLKKLHFVFSTELTPRSGKAPPKPPPGQYRKDNPLHRLYFHEISPPGKISYQMRKLVQWLTSDEAKRSHPVKRAALAHFKLITIYPWPRYSGKIARLVMNTLLLRDGYVPVVIHAVERQRYYDSLRQAHDDLIRLVVESMLRTIESATEYFQEPAEVDVA